MIVALDDRRPLMARQYGVEDGSTALRLRQQLLREAEAAGAELRPLDLLHRKSSRGTIHDAL